MLKRQWWFLLLAFIALTWSRPLCAQPGFAAAPESFLSASAAFNGHSVQIPMRDGKTLAADVYLPKSGGKFPAVLVQTPYNKSLMRPAFEGKGRYGAQSLFTDPSYAFVVTDWRGKFASQSAQTPGTPW